MEFYLCFKRIVMIFPHEAWSDASDGKPLSNISNSSSFCELGDRYQRLSHFRERRVCRKSSSSQGSLKVVSNDRISWLDLVSLSLSLSVAFPSKFKIQSDRVRFLALIMKTSDRELKR